LTIENNYQTNWEKHKNETKAVYEKEGKLEGALFQYALCTYQVNNGGFQQYFQNGYASDVNDEYSEIYDNVDLHSKMVSDIKELFPQLKDNNIFIEMISILEDFSEDEIDKNKIIFEEEYDVIKDEYYIIEEENDDYGRMNSYFTRTLDKRFYEVYEEFGKLIDANI